MKRFILILLAVIYGVFMAKAKVVPSPATVTGKSGTFVIPGSLSVATGDSMLLPAVHYLETLVRFPVKTRVDTSPADIRLAIVPDSLSYRVEVRSDGISITGRDYEGVINGIATLRQLMPAQITAGAEIECVEIADSPYYTWRGFMLDCARHFFTVKELEKVLDMMALYKLNTFHWHLSDDQAWRAEIMCYPELTAKGAFNPLNHLDRICLDRAQREANDDFLLPDDRLKITSEGDTLYGGYYTQADMRHIVAYAADRGIHVIPEIDVPGHSWILTSIKPDISCDDGSPAGAVCPGKDKTMEVIQNIFDELLEIFPSKYIHVGGDEVVKDRWYACPDCRLRTETEDLECVDALQGWFIRRMELFFRNRGRIMIGWDEIAYDGIGSENAIMWWRGDNWRVLSKASADGKRIVCSSTDCLYVNCDYFDSYIHKILELDPRTMHLAPSQQRLVLGMQANLWAEVVPTLRRAEYQMFPRILALAEASWTSACGRMSFKEFWDRLPGQYRLLDNFNVAYGLPEILGVGEENVFVGSTVMAPYDRIGSVLRYTTDGSIPTKRSKILKKPVKVTKESTFGIASFRPDGSRANFKIVNYKPTVYIEADDGATPANNGLSVSWHRNDGIKSCNDIPASPVLNELTAQAISLPYEVDKDRALIFRGYVFAPADGIYDFAITSDDGSTVRIGDKIIIDNDGYHGTIKKQRQLALRHGWHPIEIRYFDFADGGGLLDGHITCISNPEIEIKFAH